MKINFFISTLISSTVKPDLARDARRKLKEERQKKKERKRNRKAKMEKECLAERMNCFRLVNHSHLFIFFIFSVSLKISILFSH